MKNNNKIQLVKFPSIMNDSQINVNEEIENMLKNEVISFEFSKDKKELILTMNRSNKNLELTDKIPNMYSGGPKTDDDYMKLKINDSIITVIGKFTNTCLGGRIKLHLKCIRIDNIKSESGKKEYEIFSYPRIIKVYTELYNTTKRILENKSNTFKIKCLEDNIFADIALDIPTNENDRKDIYNIYQYWCDSILSGAYTVDLPYCCKNHTMQMLCGNICFVNIVPIGISSTESSTTLCLKGTRVDNVDKTVKDIQPIQFKNYPDTIGDYCNVKEYMDIIESSITNDISNDYISDVFNVTINAESCNIVSMYGFLRAWVQDIKNKRKSTTICTFTNSNNKSYDITDIMPVQINHDIDKDKLIVKLKGCSENDTFIKSISNINDINTLNKMYIIANAIGHKNTKVSVDKNKKMLTYTINLDYCKEITAGDVYKVFEFLSNNDNRKCSCMDLLYHNILFKQARFSHGSICNQASVILELNIQYDSAEHNYR